MPRFRGYNQQDAQEFFNMFVDHLHSELAVGGPAHRGEDSGSEGDSPRERVLFPPSTFLSDKFQGVQCTEIRFGHSLIVCWFVADDASLTVPPPGPFGAFVACCLWLE